MAPEVTPFPSDFGEPENHESMVEWDVVFPWSGHLPGFMQEVYDLTQKLPLPRPGYKWELVTRADEPVYDAAGKTATLQWAQIKE